MTLSTLIAAALIVIGQQGAPLIGQKELPPPPAVARQAAPPAQTPPQPQPAVPPQAAPAAPTAEPLPAPAPEPQGTQKDPGPKRVAAFWVLLPGKSK